jgi:hypothetical protein
MPILSFKEFIDQLGLQDTCDCPKDHVPFLQLRDTCLCLPQDEMRFLRCTLNPDYGALEDPMFEQLRESLQVDEPFEFSVGEGDGVSCRISKDGIGIQFADGRYFPVPEDQHGKIWLLVRSRLS